MVVRLGEQHPRLAPGGVGGRRRTERGDRGIGGAGEVEVEASSEGEVMARELALVAAGDGDELPGLRVVLQVDGGLRPLERGDAHCRIALERPVHVLEGRAVLRARVLPLALQPVGNGRRNAVGDVREVHPAIGRQQSRQEEGHAAEGELGRGGRRHGAGGALLPHQRIAQRVVQPDDDGERIAVAHQRAVEIERGPGPSRDLCGFGAQQPRVGAAIGAEERLPVEPPEGFGVLERALDDQGHLLARPGQRRRAWRGERIHDHPVQVGRRITANHRPNSQRGDHQEQGDADRRSGQAPRARQPRRPADDGELCGIQRVGKCHRRGEAIGGNLGQRLFNGGLQLDRDGRPDHLERRRPFVQVAREEGLRGAPGERRLTGQHLEQHAAERIDVGAPIDLLRAAGLLGAHVRRCAHGQPELGEVGMVHAADGAGDAEVGDHRLALAQQDVLRLDVPVHHARHVGVRQCGRHVAHDRERVGERELRLAPHPLAQRLAGDQRHDVEHHALGPTRVVERHEVRMLERAGDGDLALEALESDGGRDVRIEDLHCDVTLELGVAGAEDRGHPAASELVAELVSRPQGGLQRLQLLSHGTPR